MRLFLVFVVLAILFTIPFLIWGSGFDETFTREGTAAWLEPYGDWAWVAAVGLLTADLVLPVPATAVIGALGYLYGAILGGFIGALGSLLSGGLAYGVCWLVGRRAAVWIVGERDLFAGEHFLRTVGPWAVAVSRWLPLFPEVIACLSGLVHLRAGVFFLALACGSLPMAFTFAAVGAAGVSHPLLALGLSAGLPVLLWPIARHLLNRRGVDSRKPDL